MSIKHDTGIPFQRTESAEPGSNHAEKADTDQPRLIYAERMVGDKPVLDIVERVAHTAMPEPQSCAIALDQITRQMDSKGFQATQAQVVVNRGKQIVTVYDFEGPKNVVAYSIVDNQFGTVAHVVGTLDLRRETGFFMHIDESTPLEYAVQGLGSDCTGMNWGSEQLSPYSSEVVSGIDRYRTAIAETHATNRKEGRQSEVRRRNRGLFRAAFGLK